MNSEFYSATENQKIIPAAQQPSYKNRCVQCRYGFTIKYDGVTCSACNIANCARCFWGTASSDYTMDYNFPPVSDGTGYSMKCYQCKAGYVLN